MPFLLISDFFTRVQDVPAGNLSMPIGWQTSLITFIALLIPSVLALSYWRTPKRDAVPFRFLDLPPELRDSIYEYFLEDPHYPPEPETEERSGSLLGRIIPRWIHRARSREGKHRKTTWIFLANKQIYAEYFDALCKKSHFTLTVSPSNYPALSRSTISEPNNPTTMTTTTRRKKIWQIGPKTLQQLKKCDIKLITTSSMLGVPDPRSMAPASWPLAKQVREELRDVKNVSELNLHVRAIGDPLWNPLWVWYHASQSFKGMGSTPGSSPSAAEKEEAPVAAVGPKLHRITFSLDTWSPGENYLERDGEGRWAWWCMSGHCVATDTDTGMTVREFCARLYADCNVCRPGSEEE